MDLNSNHFEIVSYTVRKTQIDFEYETKEDSIIFRKKI